MTVLGVTALVLTLGGSNAHAQSKILNFTDAAIGTNQMQQALNGLGAGYTITNASSITDFTSKLTGGGYDLAVFFQQSNGSAAYDAAFSAIAGHISTGGAAIAADWTKTNAHAAAFGATFATGSNHTTVTITDAALLSGVGSTVSLQNPGWGIFATDMTASGGTVSGVFENAAAAIVRGNGGRTYFNGFLNDTFVNGAQGQALFTNQIRASLGVTATAVPEPSEWLAMGMAGTSVMGLMLRARRRKNGLTA